MLFNTIDFIIFFVIVFTAIVIIKKGKYQHLFLLGASFFFFYYSNNYLITLLIISTILDFIVGKEIWKTKDLVKKKRLLILSVVGNLGLLGFYKYADFSISQFNNLANSVGMSIDIELLNLILPVGISFYTFQTLSYTIDIYRGKLTPSKSFWEFALFVSFFPQLVAGPIVRASHFLPQLREKIDNVKNNFGAKQIIIKSSNLKLGLTIMGFGFFKKMFFADNIGLFVDDIFQNPLILDSFSVILGAIAFGVQIYCDFSGYSDIAIGAALILGFKIPINFNKPYFATSPADFWRKWHISLSTWVRDYLYFPLIFKNRKSSKRLFSSLFTSFFLLGLWHGAGWNFIIFGMIHGIYVAVDTVIRQKIPYFNEKGFLKSRTGKIISILVTQFLIFFAFIAFRLHDLDHVFYSMYKYVIWDFETEQVFDIISLNKFPIFLIIAFFALHFISYKHRNLHEFVAKIKIQYWFAFLGFLLITILIFQTGTLQNFIYFRF